MALVPVKRRDLAPSCQCMGPTEISGQEALEQGILCPQPQHSQDRGGGLGVPRRGPAGISLTFGQMGRKKGN